jgi:hypothetical protein
VGEVAPQVNISFVSLPRVALSQATREPLLAATKLVSAASVIASKEVAPLKYVTVAEAEPSEAIANAPAIMDFVIFIAYVWLFVYLTSCY